MDVIWTEVDELVRVTSSVRMVSPGTPGKKAEL